MITAEEARKLEKESRIDYIKDMQEHLDLIEQAFEETVRRHLQEGYCQLRTIIGVLSTKRVTVEGWPRDALIDRIVKLAKYHGYTVQAVRKGASWPCSQGQLIGYVIKW